MVLEALVETAVHEAGHAVAALAHGVGVRTVHVHPLPGGTLGSCWLASAPEDRGPGVALQLLEAGDQAVELLQAGFPAPDRPQALPWLWMALAAREGASPPPGDSRSDGDRVQDLGAAREDPGEARAQVRALLRENWSAVHGIAQELLHRGQLDGDRVAELFARAGGRTAAAPVGRAVVPLRRAPEAGTNVFLIDFRDEPSQAPRAPGWRGRFRYINPRCRLTGVMR
jgi:hypothetical protein